MERNCHREVGQAASGSREGNFLSLPRTLDGNKSIGKRGDPREWLSQIVLRPDRVRGLQIV